MKKWLIFYIILIIVIAIFIKATDRRYVITDTKLSSYERELKQEQPDISDVEIKRALESKFMIEILKKSFIMSTIIIVFAFIMTSLRNGFIAEFFHLHL